MTDLLISLSSIGQWLVGHPGYTTTTTKYYRRRILSGEATLEDTTTEITTYYRTLQATILLKNITHTSHDKD